MASLRYADNGQQTTEGFARLRRTTDNRQRTTELRLRWGYAKATPDYETTSQQDNEWRLRKVAPDNGQQNLGFATLRRTKDMRLTTKGIGLSSFDF